MKCPISPDAYDIYVTGNVWNQAFYRMPRQSIECPAGQAFYRMSGCFHNFHTNYELGLRPREFLLNMRII